MTWVAVAIVGAGALGAGASMASSSKQTTAANRASDRTLQQQQLTRSDLMPWIVPGQHVAGQLEGMVMPGGDLVQPFNLSNFRQSPSYQWQLQQGQQAIDKASAARGNLYAPQTLQDLGKFQQGLASTDFNNAYNQYHAQQQQQYNMMMGVSQAGGQAAMGTGQIGAGAANAAGMFQTSGAAAQGAGYMGAANALAGGGLGLAGYNTYLNQLQNPNYFNSAQGNQWWQGQQDPNAWAAGGYGVG